MLFVHQSGGPERVRWVARFSITHLLTEVSARSVIMRMQLDAKRTFDGPVAVPSKVNPNLISNL